MTTFYIVKAPDDARANWYVQNGAGEILSRHQLKRRAEQRAEELAEPGETRFSQNTDTGEWMDGVTERDLRGGDRSSEESRGLFSDFGFGFDEEEDKEKERRSGLF